MKIARQILIVGAVFGASVSASAQDSDICLAGEGLDLTKTCITEDEILGALDLTTPDNALFSLMGSAPETVIRPKVGDKLSVSMLPQVVDAFGNEDYSIGIEVNPGLLMMPETYTMRELIDGNPSFNRARNFSRVTFSAAASQQTSGQTTATYGLGVNFNFDSGSPMQALAQGTYGNCIRDSYSDASKDQNPNLAGAILEVQGKVEDESSGQLSAEEVIAEAERIIQTDPKYEYLRKAPKDIVQKCVARAAPWNRKVVGGGAAVIHTDIEAAENDTMMQMAMSQTDSEETGAAAWFSYAGPSPLDDDNGQIAFGAKLNENLSRERKSGDDTITETYDGWQLGVRYTHRLASSKSSAGVEETSFRGFAELAYAEEKFGDIRDEYTQAGIGFEVQLQKNLYFQAVIGDTFGSSIDRDTYLSGQFKWSFSRSRAS